jgi:hypothetical protein
MPNEKNQLSIRCFQGVGVGGRTKKLTDVTLFVNVGVFLLIFLNFFFLQLFIIYLFSVFSAFVSHAIWSDVYSGSHHYNFQPPSLARVHYDDDTFQLCD